MSFTSLSTATIPKIIIFQKHKAEKNSIALHMTAMAIQLSINVPQHPISSPAFDGFECLFYKCKGTALNNENNLKQKQSLHSCYLANQRFLCDCFNHVISHCVMEHCPCIATR